MGAYGRQIDILESFRRLHLIDRSQFKHLGISYEKTLKDVLVEDGKRYYRRYDYRYEAVSGPDKGNDYEAYDGDRFDHRYERREEFSYDADPVRQDRKNDAQGHSDDEAE